MQNDRFQSDFENEVKEIESWFNSPRFEKTTRLYTAEDVARLRPSVRFPTKSSITSKKLWDILQNNSRTYSHSHTFGALDPIQVIQMAPHLSTVYVSGWQSSSTASTSNEPGPDFADYPYTTLPNKVEQLFRAQIFHDRKQREARARMTPLERSKTPFIDFYRPIIADGDTGFGGVTSTMKLIQLFCEAGTAGVHIEDQKSGTKKCGHMGGKVMVSTKEHIERLSAARLMCDVLHTELVLISRTDSEAATYIDSNFDGRDHPFILGVTNINVKESFSHYIDKCIKEKKNRESCEASWIDTANLMTFPELVAKKANLNDMMKNALFEKWCLLGFSIDEMKRDAKKNYNLSDSDLYFNWELPRSQEGFYRAKGSDLMCIARCCSFAPYCDVVWAESSHPDIIQAERIARSVKAQAGSWVKLAYNCSPSFNWSASGMSDEDILHFQSRLGKAGYVWQFITLAGFHCNGTSVSAFASDYAKRGMLAYVAGIQRPQTNIAPELQKHQKWSGTELLDRALIAATGGNASTISMQNGVTEVQFEAKL